jgi:hypothetical protein
MPPGRLLLMMGERLLLSDSDVRVGKRERRILVVSCRGRTAEGTHAAPDAQ